MADPTASFSTRVQRLMRGDLVTHPASAESIDQLEERLGIRLPRVYKKFLSEMGSLAIGSISFLGVEENRGTAGDILSFVSFLQMIDPAFPRALVPILISAQTQFFCIVCDPASPDFERGPVVAIDVDSLPVDHQNYSLCGYFERDLFGFISREYFKQVGLRQLERRTAEFNRTHQYDHAKGGKLPSNHQWRPYRYCIQDVLFGSVVVRHNRDRNSLQVDVFLAADISGYQPDDGAKALTVFLLSEAYKCGGTMEIEFTDRVEGGTIPAAIRRVAAQSQVNLSKRDRLLPDESRVLYAALTGFSPALRAVLDELKKTAGLSIERACYVVHHGVWSKPEAEAIVLSSAYPDTVLGGENRPEHRHLYLRDLQDAGAALLGGALDLRLSLKEHDDGTGINYDLEDDVRDLEIGFDPVAYAKTYFSLEDLIIPWLVRPAAALDIVPAKTPMTVLVRPRDAAGLKAHLPADVLLARGLREKKRTNGSGYPLYIVVPNDFYQLGELEKQLVDTCYQAGIGLLVCPWSMSALFEEAASRLTKSRVLRND